MYDAEMGFPGLIIDGTECSGGEGEPLPLSESYEDMVSECQTRSGTSIKRRVSDVRSTKSRLHPA